MVMISCLCGGAVVVAEQPAEAFATDDVAVAPADLIAGLDDGVAQALVVAFGVVVAEEGVDGFAERPFPEEDHAVEGFVLE